MRRPSLLQCALLTLIGCLAGGQTASAYLTDTATHRGLVSGNEVWSVDVGSGERSKLTERGFFGAVGYRSDGVAHVLGNESPRVRSSSSTMGAFTSSTHGMRSLRAACTPAALPKA